MEPPDHALGRSRDGLFTRIHLLVDGSGVPLAFTVTGGQVHETKALEDLLVQADDRSHDIQGAPIAWPACLAGDKGCRAAWVDELLGSLGVMPVIPSKSNEARGGRNLDFERDLYRRRNIVERAIGWLKEYRCISSRFERTAFS